MTPTKLTKVGLALYLASATAFLHELIGEITGFRLYTVTWEIHELTELATLSGFVVGALLIWRSHKALHARNEEVEHLLRAAQGEFFAMVKKQFDQWDLSAAEQDVALLTVKGLTVAEIAEARQTTQGTVKSQNNAIYRKAGVKNRTQLLGILIDELLVDPSAQSDRIADSQSAVAGGMVENMRPEEQLQR